MQRAHSQLGRSVFLCAGSELRAGEWNSRHLDSWSLPHWHRAPHYVERSDNGGARTPLLTTELGMLPSCLFPVYLFEVPLAPHEDAAYPQ